MKKTAYILDGKSCETKQKLFRTFVELLPFPEYFSYNWDSFEEILFETLEQDKNAILIIENSIHLLEKELENREIFLEIIDSLEREINVKTYKC